MLRDVCIVALLCGVGCLRPGEGQGWAVSVAPHAFQHHNRSTYQDIRGEVDAGQAFKAGRELSHHITVPASNRTGALVEKNASMALVSRTALHLSLRGETWGDFKDFMDGVALKFLSTVNDGFSILQGAVSDIPILKMAMETSDVSGHSATWLAQTILDDRVGGMISDSLHAVFGLSGGNLTATGLATAGLIDGIKSAYEAWQTPLTARCECLNQLTKRKRVITLLNAFAAAAAMFSDGNIRNALLALSGGTATAIMPFLIIGGSISRLGAVAMRAWGTPFLAMWDVKCASVCDTDGQVPDDTTVTDKDVAQAKKGGATAVTIEGTSFPIEDPTQAERQQMIVALDRDLGSLHEFYENFGTLTREESVMTNLGASLHGVGGSDTTLSMEKRKELNSQPIDQQNLKFTRTSLDAVKTMNIECVDIRNECAVQGEHAVIPKPNGGVWLACNRYKEKCRNLDQGILVQDANFEWYNKCCVSKEGCANTITAA